VQSDRDLNHASVQVRQNQLKWLPAELVNLSKLELLMVRRLVRLLSLLTAARPQLDGNFFPAISGLTLDDGQQCARRVDEIVAGMTHIGMIRERATEICIGLQDLALPAFVTLTIVDESVHENAIRMWAKWELITAVKHFRDRRRVSEAQVD
jgi:hypothetical protein